MHVFFWFDVNGNVIFCIFGLFTKNKKRNEIKEFTTTFKKIHMAEMGICFD